MIPEPDHVFISRQWKGANGPENSTTPLHSAFCILSIQQYQGWLLQILTWINNLKEQRSSDLCGKDQWGPSVCYCAESSPDGAAAAATACAQTQPHLNAPAAAAVYFSCTQHTLLFGKWSANIGEKFIKLMKSVYWLGLDFQACKKIFLGSLHEKFEQTNPLSVSCSIIYVSIPNEFLSRMYNFLWELEGFFWFNPSNPNPDPNTADDRKVEGPSQR